MFDLKSNKILLASNQVRDIHTYIYTYIHTCIWINVHTYMQKTFKWLTSIRTEYRSFFPFDFLFQSLSWYCFFYFLLSLFVSEIHFCQMVYLVKAWKKSTTNMKSLRLHIIPISIFALLVPKTDLNSFFIDFFCFFFHIKHSFADDTRPFSSENFNKKSKNIKNTILKTNRKGTKIL